MPTYRFYLCDEQGHFLRVREVDCQEGDIKTAAHDVLLQAPDYIVAVEVWDRETRLARIERPNSN